MKRIIKIFSILLSIIFLLIILNKNIVLAAGQGGMPNINELNPTNDITEMPSKMLEIIALIASIIQIVGIVISVIVAFILGIKYIIASAEGKAEYKKTIISFLIGSALLVSSATIVRIISDLTLKTFTIN